MLFGIAAAPVAAHAQSRQAMQPAAILTVFSGDVLVRGARGDFSSAIDGAVLYDGAMLRTSADARALITLFEGSTMELDPASDITIDAASMRGDSTLARSLGRTWNVVMHLTTADSRYELLTPAATASVRGGEFEVAAAEGTSVPTAMLATTEQRVPTTLVIQTTASVVSPAQPTSVQAKAASRSTSSAQSADRLRWATAQTVTLRALLAARARDRWDQSDRGEAD